MNDVAQWYDFGAIDYAIAQIRGDAEAVVDNSVSNVATIDLLHGNENDKKTFRYYQRKADRGNTLCMGCLALCYALGRGVTRDLKMARKYDMLADDGIASQ